MATDPRAFRDALGQFATGVTIVTTSAADGTPIGLTANSFTSVSLEPPLVLVSLSHRLKSLPSFATSAAFSINVLGEDHGELAMRFATPHRDKWSGGHFACGENGCPRFTAAAAVFECRKYAVHPAGDHDLYLGEVTRFATQQERRPLIFHRGRFGRILSTEHPATPT
jgi:flavin reductase (DIM6/NTAB) family NADH-FMN oxidoreductase RutF